MTGGTQSEYRYTEVDIESMREKISAASTQIVHENAAVINSTSVYKVSGQDALNVVVGFDSSIEDKTLSEYKESFRTTVLELLQASDSSVEESSYTNI